MATTQTVRIQVIFRVETQYGPFQDALWFSPEEYANLTQEDLNTLEQQKIDNWLTMMSTPSPILSDAEKLAQIQADINNCQAVIADQNNRITELQAEEDAINGQ